MERSPWRRETLTNARRGVVERSPLSARRVFKEALAVYRSNGPVAVRAYVGAFQDCRKSILAKLGPPSTSACGGVGPIGVYAEGATSPRIN